MTPQDLENIRSELDITQADFAVLLQCDYVGYKRWVTAMRPIPRYIERSAQALLFIRQNGLQETFEKYLNDSVNKSSQVSIGYYLKAK